MKCLHCPVQAGKACVGESGRFKHFCGMAINRDPIKIKMIVNRSAIEDGSLKLETDEEKAKKRADAKKVAKLLQLAKLCPHFKARSDCGCGVNSCGIMKGKGGLVTLQECVDCQSELNPNIGA